MIEHALEHIAVAPELYDASHALALLGLQSERYVTDEEFRIAVDNVLEIHTRVSTRSVRA